MTHHNPVTIGALLCAGVSAVANGAAAESIWIQVVGFGFLALYVANTWRRP